MDWVDPESGKKSIRSLTAIAVYLGNGNKLVVNILTTVVFVGGSRGTPPSLDLTFPPTGLSENLGGMERGGRGKEKGKGGGDHLPYFPHWLLPQIPS